MRNYPNIYRLGDLKDVGETQRELSDGRWVPARPLGLPSFFTSLLIGWNVFRGRYDALLWPEDE